MSNGLEVSNNFDGELADIVAGMAREFVWVTHDRHGVYVGLPKKFGEFNQGVHFFRGAKIGNFEGIDQKNGDDVAGVMKRMKKGFPRYDTTSGVHMYETMQIGDSK